MTHLPTVIATLRFLAGGWMASEDDKRWLAEVAQQLDSADLNACCPLCQEVECDTHCPIKPHRRADQDGGWWEYHEPDPEDTP